MTKDKKDKIGKEQLLLEASRLGRLDELENILSQSQPYRLKKKTNPLASLRKPFGPNSSRDPATGFTCLHHAALNGHSECVKLILFYGAKLNAVDYKGSSALHLAAWAGNLDVVQILLAHNVALSNEQQRFEDSRDCENSNSDQANWKASLFRNQEPLEIDLCNNDNQTPLSLAAQFGHTQVVAELIRHGANVHIRNNQLESALDLACASGRLETVCLLLDSSAELQADLRRPHSAIPVPMSKLQQCSNYSMDLATTNQNLQHNAQLVNQNPLLQRTQSMLDSNQVKAPSSAPKQTSSSSSSSGWVSLLRRNSHANSADLQVVSPRRNSNEQQQAKQVSDSAVVGGETSSMVAEHGLKLLPHSPLHYATRRGHHNLVSTLLYSYKANILQISSMGGVLHEIALANGKHLDLIGLFFQFIANRFNSNSSASSGQVVNNSISCLPEMVDKFLKLKNEQQQTVFQLLTQINNRSAHETRELIYRYSEQILNLNQHYQGTLLNQHLERVQQQQQQQQQICAVHRGNQMQYFNPQRHQQAQFSDMSQINSFVTLKRMPKHSLNPSNQQQQQQQHVNYQYKQQNSDDNPRLVHGTQTIDRRANNLGSFQQHQQKIPNQNLNLMTRSVSNLTDWLNHTSDSMQINETPDTRLSGNQQGATRQQRSQSRDLSSLPEAEAKCQQVQLINSGDASKTCSMDNSNQLVRSQTDCSQLMNRFFASNQSGNLVPDQRKSINRHYHVYDHQFYPPRLMADVNEDCKQQANFRGQPAAVNGPLNRDNQFRSSMRSSVMPLTQQNNNHNQLNRNAIDRGQTSIAPRQDLIELQRKIQAEQDHSMAYLKQQPIQGSMSLESHMNENCSSQQQFDATRRAIMNDFDQLIGQELLNRNHAFIISNNSASKNSLLDSNQANTTLPNSSSSSSILTGVMLDMDKSGSQLTVSGTRISFAQSPASQQSAGTVSEGDNQAMRNISSSCEPSLQNNDLNRSSGPKQTPPVKPPRPATMLLSRTSSELGDQASQTTNRLSLSQAPRVKPPPPPIPPQPAARNSQRLSLRQQLQIVPPNKRDQASQNESQASIMMLSSANSACSNGSSDQSSKNANLSNDLARQGNQFNQLLQDQDSGVCTSNSPASLSHESDKSNLDEQQQASFGQPLKSLEIELEQSDLPDTHIISPPSPNTAQMCIEEAFIPLAENRTETIDEAADSFTREHMIDWLVKTQAAGSVESEPDYDNLHEIVEKRPLSTMVHYNGDLSCIEDDDYANTTLDGDHESSSAISPETPNPALPRREFMLKVVIDNANLIGSNEKEDTFYIDPSELKKIVASGSSGAKLSADAETITDEELSAALDENSGLIRLTLRKRTTQDIPRQVERKSQTNDLNGIECELSDQIAATSLMEKQLMSSAAKRSKLTGQVSFDVQPSNLRAQQSDRRKSEILLGTSRMSPKLARPPSSELTRWFSSKLAGLIEYESKFASNGFDSLQFMNHPSLMNDSLLASIGIENESHRMLILETIRQDLPQVNLDKLTAEEQTIGQLMRVLNLEFLIEQMGEINELSKCQLADRNAINSLRCYAMENLNLAHRIRLSLALDTVSNRFKQDADNAEEFATPTKDSSEGSNSCVNETELISHETSSSSDLQSIKSVVSIKQAIKVADQADNILLKTSKSTETLCNDIVDSPIDEIVAELSVQSEGTQLDRPTSQNMSRELEETEARVCMEGDSSSTIVPKQVVSGGSLVSQVARRIEEENARIASSQNQHKSVASSQKPIAAIRNKFTQATSFPLKQLQTELNSCKPVISATRVIAKQNVTSAQDSTNLSVNKPKSKLDEIRMSFERQIEQNSVTATRNVQAKQDRSLLMKVKPPPPAKPANLAQVAK